MNTLTQIFRVLLTRNNHLRSSASIYIRIEHFQDMSSCKKSKKVYMCGKLFFIVEKHFPNNWWNKQMFIDDIFRITFFWGVR